MPPAAGTVCCGGLIAKEHPLDCVSVKLCPAIVSVPVRVPPLFASKAYCTVPLPLPEAPFEIVTHGVLVAAAVQVQPAGAVTATDPVPAAADTVWDPGRQRVRTTSALVDGHRSAGDRHRPGPRTAGIRRDSELHRTVTAAARCRGGTLIHAAFDVAVHRQPPPVFTDTLTAPPPLATFCCVGDTDGRARFSLVDGERLPRDRQRS